MTTTAFAYSHSTQHPHEIVRVDSINRIGEDEDLGLLWATVVDEAGTEREALLLEEDVFVDESPARAFCAALQWGLDKAMSCKEGS